MMEQPGAREEPAGAEPAEAEVVDAEVVEAEVVEDPGEEPRPAADPGTPDAAEDAADLDSAAAVEQDLDELVSAKRERDEYLELAQRTKADFENFRKRAERDSAEAERRGRSSLVRELVPVLDNLERALLAAGIDPEGATGEENGGALGQGVLLVYRDLRSAIERAGVEAYDPTGERFDPTWHEALSTRAGDGAEPGTVVETMEKGYRLGDLVLRPARVIVSG
jgi:molecular chaperone GrpE